MAKHTRGSRPRIFFSHAAAKQIEAITDEAEIHALDRALTALSVAPDLGSPIPGSELREYTDDVDDIRHLLRHRPTHRGRRRVRRSLSFRHVGPAPQGSNTGHGPAVVRRRQTTGVSLGCKR